MFENKTYILEPMENTTDRYKLVPAENMKSIQGVCGSHHNHSSLTMEDVSHQPSQMWSRRVRGNLKFMLLERRAEGKGYAGLEGLEQPCCWLQCGWKDLHPSGGRGCPGKSMVTNSNPCLFPAGVSVRFISMWWVKSHHQGQEVAKVTTSIDSRVTRKTSMAPRPFSFSMFRFPRPWSIPRFGISELGTENEHLYLAAYAESLWAFASGFPKVLFILRPCCQCLSLPSRAVQQPAFSNLLPWLFLLQHRSCLQSLTTSWLPSPTFPIIPWNNSTLWYPLMLSHMGHTDHSGALLAQSKGSFPLLGYNQRWKY